MIALYMISVCASIVSLPLSIYDILYIPVSLYMADLISGCAHMLLDHGDCGILESFLKDSTIYELSVVKSTYPNEYAQSSLFQRICFEFQKHHEFPQRIVQKSSIEVTSTIASFTWIIQTILFIFYYYSMINPPVFMISSLIVLFSTLSQLSHQSSHDRRNPSTLLYYLRTCGLVITPEYHRIHHTTYDSHFPIITGWSYPVVNGIYTLFYK